MTQETVEARARMTHGASCAAVYEAVRCVLERSGVRGGTLVDVGCGAGALREHVRDRCERYVGADAIRHDGFPADAEFVKVDLDTGSVGLSDGSCDLVLCLETIEHVENPRALMRELVRLARPGGWILVTTPNQLNLASKLALVLKNEFIAFQERPGLYPAHITALLEVDLVRMFRENGLKAQVAYSGQGRIPLSARSFPHALSARSGARGRAFSDNVIVFAQKPA
ncbi:MAG TPA: methyltransferase domain-containing protein [Polyangiaceae bacterium]